MTSFVCTLTRWAGRIAASGRLWGPRIAAAGGIALATASVPAAPASYTVAPAAPWVVPLTPEAGRQLPAQQVAKGVQYLLLDVQQRVDAHDKTSYRHLA
ncbi:MAG TPA: hypothetical protein VFY73_14245, partial [Ideonella sp.]|nr:hypothetical protein [Ideonella sp.]